MGEPPDVGQRLERASARIEQRGAVLGRAGLLSSLLTIEQTHWRRQLLQLCYAFSELRFTAAIWCAVQCPGVDGLALNAVAVDEIEYQLWRLTQQCDQAS